MTQLSPPARERPSPMGVTMSRRLARTLALVMSTPMAVLGYNPIHAVASQTPSCDGHAATITVTRHSPHVVHGTDGPDVIVIEAAGHVVDAGAGNDLVCGSGGHDVIDAGAGNDVVFGGGGKDTING